MAELTYTLGEHPQIIELLSVLEKNNLQKQKEEVQALVGYIDGMEDKLAQMMEEMKEIRLEVGRPAAPSGCAVWPLTFGTAIPSRNTATPIPRKICSAASLPPISWRA